MTYLAGGLRMLRKRPFRRPQKVSLLPTEHQSLSNVYLTCVLDISAKVKRDDKSLVWWFKNSEKPDLPAIGEGKSY
jgi:hypothetical protein